MPKYKHISKVDRRLFKDRTRLSSRVQPDRTGIFAIPFLGDPQSEPAAYEDFRGSESANNDVNISDVNSSEDEDDDVENEEDATSTAEAEFLLEPIPGSSQLIQHDPLSHRPPPTTSPNESPGSANWEANNTDKLVKTLDEKINSVIDLLSCQQTKIDTLFELVSSLSSPKKTHSYTIKRNAQIVLPPLPLVTPDQVDALETKLLTDPEFSEQMIAHLKKRDRSSQSLYQKVRFLMEALLSSELTDLYTWTGKAGVHTANNVHLSFIDKQGCAALICKCLQYRSATVFDEKEVLRAIQEHFKRSKVRNNKVKNTQT